MPNSHRPPTPNLKPKDLLMMPHRLAIALQDDGWWVRSDIVWSKPNPMPESVTDRPAKTHEYIFLLARAERYYYDAEAVRERSAEPLRERCDRVGGANGHTVRHSPGGIMGQVQGRNRRSVWDIPTAPFPEAHFATFPPDLVKPCILSGTSERGCCPACGAPWRRLVERTGHTNGRETAHVPNNAKTKTDSTGWQPTRRGTGTWEPSCKCNAGEPVACTVLDPFAGSGTTGVVALEYGREFIGIELNPEYAEMAKRRLDKVAAQELLVMG